MHLAYPAVLSVLLFCTGLYGVLARRNAVLMLMSVELMLNAVNLDLVAFDVWLRDTLHTGQALTLFTIAVAAAEIGIGLAIVLLVFRTRGTSGVDRLRALREEDGAAEAAADTAAAAVTGSAGPADGTATDGTATDGTETGSTATGRDTTGRPTA